MIETILGLIGGAGVICSIIFGVIAFRKNDKSESKDEGESKGIMLTEIGYIKGGVDDIKRKQEQFDNKHTEVVQRLSVVEESTKSAHKRIDEIENKA